MRALGPFGSIFGRGGLSFRGGGAKVPQSGGPSVPFREGHPPLTPPMPTYGKDCNISFPCPVKAVQLFRKGIFTLYFDLNR